MAAQLPHLVVGADGLIGNALFKRLQALGPVLGTTRRDHLPASWIKLDLGQEPAVWTATVSTAFICAAVSTIQACRQDPSASRQVNVDHTVRLAESLLRAGARVVFLSTNRVFDGSRPNVPADAPLSPVTEYGEQKAEAERRLGALGVGIVRLTKVFGPASPLLSGWLRSLQQGQPIQPLSDMMMAPVPLPFVAEALVRVAQKPLTGVLQLSADEEVSYEQAAWYLASKAHAAPALIRPMRSSAAGFSAGESPPHATLDTRQLKDEYGLTPPPWRSTVDLAVSIDTTTTAE